MTAPNPYINPAGHIIAELWVMNDDRRKAGSRDITPLLRYLINEGIELKKGLEKSFVMELGMTGYYKTKDFTTLCISCLAFENRNRKPVIELQQVDYCVWRKPVSKIRRQASSIIN